MLFLMIRLNTTRVWWLSSELLGETRISYISPRAQKGEQIGAEYIEPGELVCEAERDELVRMAMETELTVQLQNFYVSAATFKRPSGRIELGWLGYVDTEQVDPGKQYIYRCTGLTSPLLLTGHEKKLADDATKAFMALMSLLPSDGQAKREDLIVQQIVRKGNNPPVSARHAILIARSVRFIARKRSYRYIFEFFKVFKSRPTAGGHASCKINLTELGRLWNRSEYPAPENQADKAPITFVGINMPIHTGDNNTSYGPTAFMGRNDVRDSTINQVYQDTQSGNIKLLAQQLAVLRAKLETQATDPARDLAIREVAAAQLAAEKGRESATFTHLAKLGKMGKWVLDIATSIGVTVAASAITQALKLPR
jgi:hypothetical protein